MTAKRPYFPPSPPPGQRMPLAMKLVLFVLLAAVVVCVAVDFLILEPGETGGRLHWSLAVAVCAAAALLLCRALLLGSRNAPKLLFQILIGTALVAYFLDRFLGLGGVSFLYVIPILCSVTLALNFIFAFINRRFTENGLVYLLLNIAVARHAPTSALTVIARAHAADLGDLPDRQRSSRFWVSSSSKAAPCAPNSKKRLHLLKGRPARLPHTGSTPPFPAGCAPRSRRGAFCCRFAKKYRRSIAIKTKIFLPLPKPARLPRFNGQETKPAREGERDENFADDRLVYPRRQRRGDFGAGAAAGSFWPTGTMCACLTLAGGLRGWQAGRRLGGRFGRRRGDLPRRAGCARRMRPPPCARWRPGGRMSCIRSASSAPSRWQSASPGRAARRFCTPTTRYTRTTPTTFSPSRRWGRAAVRAFTRHIAAGCDAFIAPTAKVARLLESYGVACPVHTLPTGIDTARFARVDPAAAAALRARWGVQPGQAVLLYVGRLAQEKNIGELLALAQRLGAQGAAAKLVLVGDGPQRARLQAQAGPQVVFAGMAAPSFVPVCYAAGDIFLSASTSETQGLTYLEALAAGRPAVCRADPCLQDVIVDGVNGWQYRTPEELERHVRALLADEPARRAMGRCAAATAARFSEQAFALQAAALYRRAIIQKQAARAAGKGLAVWSA